MSDLRRRRAAAKQAPYEVEAAQRLSQVAAVHTAPQIVRAFEVTTSPGRKRTRAQDVQAEAIAKKVSGWMAAKQAEADAWKTGLVGPEKGDNGFSCLMHGIPQEIRDRILWFACYTDGPVWLTHYKEVQQSYYEKHLKKCIFAKFAPRNMERLLHTTVAWRPYSIEPVPAPVHVANGRPGSDADVCADLYCTNPLTGECSLIEVPRSSRDLRLVCKNFAIAGNIQWLVVNEFHFFTAAEAVDILTKPNSGFKHGSEKIQIRHVSFNFQSLNAEAVFPQLAKLLPDLTTLGTSMFYNTKLVKFEKFTTKLGPDGGIQCPGWAHAKGILDFLSAFRNLTRIERVDLIGEDVIAVKDEHGPWWATHPIDINKTDSIGPVIRELLVKKDGPFTRRIEENQTDAAKRFIANNSAAMAERLEKIEAKRRKADEADTGRHRRHNALRGPVRKPVARQKTPPKRTPAQDMQAACAAVEAESRALQREELAAGPPPPSPRPKAVLATAQEEMIAAGPAFPSPTPKESKIPTVLDLQKMPQHRDEKKILAGPPSSLFGPYKTEEEIQTDVAVQKTLQDSIQSQVLGKVTAAKAVQGSLEEKSLRGDATPEPHINLETAPAGTAASGIVVLSDDEGAPAGPFSAKQQATPRQRQKAPDKPVSPAASTNAKESKAPAGPVRQTSSPKRNTAKAPAVPAPTPILSGHHKKMIAAAAPSLQAIKERNGKSRPAVPGRLSPGQLDDIKKAQTDMAPKLVAKLEEMKMNKASASSASPGTGSGPEQSASPTAAGPSPPRGDLKREYEASASSVPPPAKRLRFPDTQSSPPRLWLSPQPKNPGNTQHLFASFCCYQLQLPNAHAISNSSSLDSTG